jgi:hypothetical protein
MRRHRAIRRCTTIIEIVAAMVILSIALPPLVGAFTEASMQSIHPSNATVAAFLVTERMEEIVAARYSGSGGYAGVYAEASASTPVSGFPAFSRQVEVTPTDANLQTVGSDIGYAKVRVTVTWSDREIRIERMFTDY